ncbi:hypothetical protein ACIHFC_09765 [Streptomyces sp. NPDC052013]|uniref:hypothetical protein n=1 Tax=Streptomyces sp. NPDC052013 TaxID=3365679 RepID=UPI0037D84AD6
MSTATEQVSEGHSQMRDSSASMSIRGGFRRPVSTFANQWVLRPTKPAATSNANYLPRHWLVP